MTGLVRRLVDTGLPYMQAQQFAGLEEIITEQVLDGMLEKDTNGDPVPVWVGRTFTYDGSNNLETETVDDGADVWIKTYGYTAGNQTSDSGWVKQ